MMPSLEKRKAARDLVYARRYQDIWPKYGKHDAGESGKWGKSYSCAVAAAQMLEA